MHPLKQHRLNSRGEHSLSEWQDGASQKIDLYVGISAVRGTRRWNKSGGVESGGWYGRCGGACVRACIGACDFECDGECVGECKVERGEKYG